MTRTQRRHLACRICYTIQELEISCLLMYGVPSIPRCAYAEFFRGFSWHQAKEFYETDRMAKCLNSIKNWNKDLAKGIKIFVVSKEVVGLLSSV